MDTHFNFNSAICTSRVQSERLLSLGLKKETADMKWLGCSDENGDIYYMLFDVPHHFRSTDIPAWSLGRLWELYWSNKAASDCLFGCGKYMNPYVKMIAMIEYDIEDGTFNKDYLDKQWE